MGYWNKQTVVAVPADKINDFNIIMELHGYGKNTIGMETPVGATADAKAKAPTHYCIEFGMDNGMLAAARLALDEANKNKADKDKGFIDIKVSVKTEKKRMDEVLSKKGLKSKVEKVK